MYALLPVQEGGSTALADASRKISPGAGTDMSLGIMPASWCGTPPEEGWFNIVGAFVARRAASSLLSLFRRRCRFVVVAVVI